MKRFNIAVVGATGLVGSTILKVLEERSFPVENFYFFSSEKSAGSKIIFNNREYVVEKLNEGSFDKDLDIVFFAAGGLVSEKFAKLAADKGIVVIDNSSVYRMDKDVPLIVPEVNPQDINNHKGIISNPNCTTIQALVALKPLDEKFKLRRVIYSTYQAVSGSGIGGLKDLEEGKVECYPYQIQNNTIPQIDSFMENGYSKEEMKMIEETKKILNNEDLKVTATTVRVPVKYSHCISVNLEFERHFELDEIYNIFERAPGIVLKDDIQNQVYPMPLDTEGSDEVYVGRIRRDFSIENGLNFWVVADNVRKGAATNAVQIAELLIKEMKND